MNSTLVPTTTLRVVVFSSAPTRHLNHLLWRISIDIPAVQVAGVVYELRAQERPRGAGWSGRLLCNLGDLDYVRFNAYRVLNRGVTELKRLPRLIRHTVNATDGSPNAAAPTIEELAGQCELRGTPFRTVSNIHSSSSLEFVREVSADVGLIFGARILKPDLFSIPRLGSINSHQHKLPDYRGSGPPGLWELRDGKGDLTVAAHRVSEVVDAGAVLDERSFPIRAGDTLLSLELKANVAGVDGLIEVLSIQSRGEIEETQQLTEGTTYKGILPHEMWAMEHAVSRERRSPSSLNPRNSLRVAATWTLALPRLALENRRLARRKCFPITILSYPALTDESAQRGSTTDRFFRYVRFWQEHYRIVSLEAAVQLLRSGSGAVDAPSIALTFEWDQTSDFLGLRAVIEAEVVPVTLFVRTDDAFTSIFCSELRSCVRRGASIGSLGRRTLDPSSSDEAYLQDEIQGSQEDLSVQLGMNVEYFSFPKLVPRRISDEALSVARQTYPSVLVKNDRADQRWTPATTVAERCAHAEMPVDCLSLSTDT